MKLATFTARGIDEPVAGVFRDDLVTALEGGQRVVDVLAGQTPRLAKDSWSLDELTLLAPIPAPGTIYAIGLNYAKHIEETGAQKPETPIVFVKVRGSAAPPGGPIVCPEVDRPRPPGARAAVDPGEGRRHLLSLRPLGDHHRRGPGP